jgi:mycothiol system anti-sigma-R factor
MSCGNPHDVDCSDVIEQVYLYLDDEIDDEQRTIVRQHLDECAPCLRQFGLENEVKALVARSCGGEIAPDALKQRLMVRLQEVRIELTTIEYRAE